MSAALTGRQQDDLRGMRNRLVHKARYFPEMRAVLDDLVAFGASTEQPKLADDAREALVALQEAATRWQALLDD